MMPQDDDIWYPSVDDVKDIHDAIVRRDPNADLGIKNLGHVEFALTYIRSGFFEVIPKTIHEKAFHLMRFLAARHPFVDGNKRTALGTTVTFYLLNGFELNYNREIKSMLILLAVREEFINDDEGIKYLSEIAEPVDIRTPLSELADSMRLLPEVIHSAKEPLEDIIAGDEE